MGDLQVMDGGYVVGTLQHVDSAADLDDLYAEGVALYRIAPAELDLTALVPERLAS